MSESMGRGVDRLAVWLATGLGLGKSPVMPGTVGSLWGLPIAWGAYQYLSIAPRLLVLLALAAVGVPICQRAARVLGSHDPGCIVWDELVSLPWVFVWLPAASVGRWELLAAGFLLFRVMDIVKPPPIDWLQRFPGGWGIMADDLMAALYAGIVLRLLAPAIASGVTTV